MKILNVTLLQSYNVTFEKKLAKMVHNSKIICIFAPKKSKIKNMVVVTGRDFRANTAKYVGVALSGEDVVVKSRAGSFRVVPISEDDIVINKRDLSGKRKLNTLDNLINELRNSND